MARRRRPKPPFQRVRDGVVVHLEPEERELLTRLLDELRAMLLGSSDEPLLRRMFPVAYHLPADAEADVEYQRLMREDLVASRLTAIATVGEALSGQGGPLDEAAMVSVMQSLNSLRLVLGTMLDVSEETDLADIADDDPLVGEHHLYGYLSYLLDSAVGVMSGT